MNTSIDSLYNLWMMLFKLCNRDGIEDEECSTLVNTMSIVEKALVLKLEKEAPHIVKILATLADFGVSEFPRILNPLLRAYDPNLKSLLKKVA
ncbi:hypothetical protein [Bartonella sp. cb54]|uniref:hypothetical protein n=1 Tax=Bartonella sp. cb54 TaxID=3385560 RepID=UPI0039A4D0FA